MHALGIASQLLASSPARITQAPDLYERQQNDVCAYISGSANSPLTCGTGSTCNVGSFGNVQCCSLTCDNNHFGCLPYTPGYPGTQDAQDIYLTCPSQSPACVKLLVLDVTNGYTISNFQFTCGPGPTSVTTTIVALKTPRSAAAVPGSASTSNAAPAATSTLPTSGSTFAAIQSSAASLTQANSAGVVFGTFTSTVFVQPSTPASSTSSTSTNNSSGSSGTPIAATIVPAVVVPILGYILLIAFATKTQRRSLLRLLTCGLTSKGTSKDDNGVGNGVLQTLSGHGNAASNAQNHNQGHITTIHNYNHGHNPHQGEYTAPMRYYQQEWQQPDRINEAQQFQMLDRRY